jgi:hypothetical protein
MIANPDHRAATRLGRAVRATTEGATVTTGGLKFLAIGLGAAAIGLLVGRLFNSTGG